MENKEIYFSGKTQTDGELRLNMRSELKKSQVIVATKQIFFKRNPAFLQNNAGHNYLCNRFKSETLKKPRI